MIVKYKSQSNPLSVHDERKKYKVVFIYLAKFEMVNREFTFGIFDGSSITLVPINELDIFGDMNEVYRVRFSKDDEIDKNYVMILGDEIFLEDGNMKDYIDYRYFDSNNKNGESINKYLVNKYFQEFLELNTPNHEM